MKTSLTTVPSFIFDQIDSDGCIVETSIQVAYYNGTVELTQNGNYINISDDSLKQFCKSILAHYPEAKAILDK